MILSSVAFLFYGIWMTKYLSLLVLIGLRKLFWKTKGFGSIMGYD